ncbi:hypothetical protein ElyMa_002854400 [Elysia marginata]|uniref:Uncharacterized protein n=1 Tax=Elysia marginata TaxID=1093978 RepID=A0AAV4HWT7_9GAST|nr:hypothetical protein ElyMa_002854400 [Elysia marginata]
MATHLRETEFGAVRQRPRASSAAAVPDKCAVWPPRMPETSPCSPSPHHASSCTSSLSPADAYSEGCLVSLAGTTLSSILLRIPPSEKISTSPIFSSNVHAVNLDCSNDTNIRKSLRLSETDPSRLSPISDTITRPKTAPGVRKRRRRRRHQHTTNCAPGFITPPLNYTNTNETTRISVIINPSVCNDKTRTSTTRSGLLFLLAMAALLGLGGSDEVRFCTQKTLYPCS